MFLFLLLALAFAQNDVLNTIYGPVRGVVKNDIRIFRGVPFAAPPVGKLRFRPPQPHKPWKTPRSAVDEGNICPQVHSLGFTIGDEDCLNLDVYIPVNVNASQPLPVMVWIYGGAYVLGDKYEFGFYEATNMVKAVPHIHVAMNYRLGVFGFFALPDLMNESNTTGNYGLLDQQFALKWIHDNAAALGADTSRVTIFGESAGAFSICWHLASAASAPYFSRAIMESGNCAGAWAWRSLANATSYSQHYATSVGCGGSGASMLACMRQLSTSAVFGGDLFGPEAIMAPLMPWVATIDGTSLIDRPSALFERGQFNRVPVMLGSNNNEGDMFIPAIPFVTGQLLPLTQTSFENVVEYFWHNATMVADLAAFYDHELTYEDILSAAMRDWVFSCPTRLSASAMSRFTDVYLYHWTFIADNWIDDRFLGDLHTAEIQFVYGNAWPPIVHWFNARDDLMVNTTQSYWLSMALYGNPNAFGNQPTWPSYNTTTRANVRLDQPTLVEYEYNADICESLFKNNL